MKHFREQIIVQALFKKNIKFQMFKYMNYSLKFKTGLLTFKATILINGIDNLKEQCSWLSTHWHVFSAEHTP